MRALDAQNPVLAGALRNSRLNDYYLVDEFNLRRRSSRSLLPKALNMVDFIGKHPSFSLRWIFQKAIRRERMIGEFDQAVRDEFARLGLRDLLQETDCFDLREEEGVQESRA